MPKPKKERGRPLKRPYPPRVDATPEDMAQAMFSHTRRSQVGVPRKLARKGRCIRCADCEREVNYPETLYRDGRCETCHAIVSV